MVLHIYVHDKQGNPPRTLYRQVHWYIFDGLQKVSLHQRAPQIGMVRPRDQLCQGSRLSTWNSAKLGHDKVKSKLGDAGTTFEWIWNIPKASHMNGVVESLIKSVRRALESTCKMVKDGDIHRGAVEKLPGRSRICGQLKTPVATLYPIFIVSLYFYIYIFEVIDKSNWCKVFI